MYLKNKTLVGRKIEEKKVVLQNTVFPTKDRPLFYLKQLTKVRKLFRSNLFGLGQK